jgi:hypothetical protein
MAIIFDDISLSRHVRGGANIFFNHANKSDKSGQVTSKLGTRV